MSLALASGVGGCSGEIVGVVGAGGPGSEFPTGGAGGNGLPGAGGSPGGPGGVDPGGPGNEPGPLGDPAVAIAGPPIRAAGARRLTRQELVRSVRRLLGNDVPVDVTALPEDTLTPFDNDVLEQSPSLALVESTETLAHDIAVYATAPARLQRLLPCTPTGGGDGACFTQFLQRFGQRILRRPLDSAEVTAMAELISYGQASGRFGDAVAVALRVFLMHPEFLYRVEPGAAVSAGRVRLTAHEVASRLSFLLQGMTPDDALLAAADSGALDTAAGLRTQALRLLASEEGKDQVRRFHAFWLGYATLNTLPIQQKLRTETDALVDRANEADRDWRYLLLADETRIDAELGTHYGLAAPAAGFAWVGYADAPRRGILAQGLFAAAGAKFTDTSPTRRGKFVRERLLCQTIPLPAAAVDVDLPPVAKTPDACKVERYRQHREDPACAGCHAFMDPIGFGLENFDELGRFRSHDRDRPACAIDGQGQLDDKTPFTGAKELATLIAAAPALEPCLGQHFIRFAVGRKLDADDGKRAQWLGNQMKAGGNSFAAMVLTYVTHDDFRHRQE